MSVKAFESCFEQVFDCVVVGAGYAGLAAVHAGLEAGKSVLLVDARGDALWESGRAFAMEPGDGGPAWFKSLQADLASRGAAGNGLIDGATAEIVATAQLRASSAAALYYAHPVAVEQADDGLVTGLIVACKEGLRRVAGRQFIDATESGRLAQLVDPSLAVRGPAARTGWACLQLADWPSDAAAELLPSLWENERRVAFDVAADESCQMALKRNLPRIGEIACGSIISHVSIEAYPTYDAGPAEPDRGNVAFAVPGLADTTTETLADRASLGHAAFARLADAPQAAIDSAMLDAPIDRPTPVQTLEADVLVAGAGTGGAFAAIAAGRGGAKTLCIEPLAFVGGIGTGGGIHSYYWGVKGGMQQELDRAVRSLMQSANGLLQCGPFNPEAKKIVLEQAMADAGVSLMTGAVLYDVQVKDGRVTKAFVAGPDGPIEVRAKMYIDGTGDGDVAAHAGASFVFGRAGDGILHAYSQSSGALRDREGDLIMRIVNYDAGWCDPTQSEDLTRARLVGIDQYLRESYDAMGRTTYVAPAIGLRQARQVETEYVLTLDDQIANRKFNDCIGYTGCHYDNHACDYAFESDEGMFWIWLCRNWRTPFACEMSYRMLVPKGVKNVLIASRAIGVSSDAHHSLRMQRDFQRTGEVCGWAAALCAASGSDAQDVPYDALRASLEATGALRVPDAKDDEGFGASMGADEFDLTVDQAAIDAALQSLDSGEAGKSLWLLYRAKDQVGEAVRERLKSDDKRVSWFAAGVVAMWGDAAAEARLLEAISDREYGFGENWDGGVSFRRWDGTEPMDNRRVVPNWLAAVAMLRCCGTAACLPAIAELAALPDQSLMTRATLATTIERLVRRRVLTDADQAQTMLGALFVGEISDAVATPQWLAGHHAEKSLRKALGEDPGEFASPRGATEEDRSWQLWLPATRARVALGLPVGDAARAFLSDERALVRRAFAAALGEGAEACAAAGQA